MQDIGLTEMHESLAKHKAMLFDRITTIETKVKTDLDTMTTRINYAFQELDSFKLRYDS